ncbi:MAG: type II toxin-antitoxin system mRNA interferase toxin, RelE/StbE family [Bacteriovoracaceae bacterium]|nr:type II toxin-antitoxin system mRNA interferase toxin, RelE/StbE family [Bacteriovoracaceae bacterium]
MAIVEITKRAQKNLKKAPREVLLSFARWQAIASEIGVVGLRTIKGYHDETLKGERMGQRSSRLNKAWRVIYKVTKGQIEIVEVLEVNKHEY